MLLSLHIHLCFITCILKNNHHRQISYMTIKYFGCEYFNVYTDAAIESLCLVMFKMFQEEILHCYTSLTLTSLHTCRGIHLWPVRCGKHVSSSLERMWGVVADAVLCHTGVLCFILCSAQRCHAVLIKALYTCCCRHWQSDRTQRRTLVIH